MRNTGVVRAPHSSISQAPVSSPAPLSAAVPQKYGWLPRIARVRPDRGHSGVVGRAFACPTRTPGDVGDGVGRAGRELAHDEAVIAGAHQAKLADEERNAL